MRLKIAILEDNAERRAAMQAWLSDRLYMYEHCFFDEPAQMTGWLDQHLKETLAISLDHDLELVPREDGTLRDPGTGRQVADYLAKHDSTCPVVLHSSNDDAAFGMRQVLVAHGWMVRLVRPYEQLEWIDEAWWPALKESIAATEAASAIRACAKQLLQEARLPCPCASTTGEYSRGSSRQTP